MIRAEPANRLAEFSKRKPLRRGMKIGHLYSEREFEVLACVKKKCPDCEGTGASWNVKLRGKLGVAVISIFKTDLRNLAKSGYAIIPLQEVGK